MKPDAVEQYREDGFQVRRGGFAREVVLLRDVIDRERARMLVLEDVTIDASGRKASILGYFGHGEDVVASFAHTERLANLVKALLGDDIYLLKGKEDFEAGHYRPELDWDAIRDEREADIRQGIDSGWTGVTPTLDT